MEKENKKKISKKKILILVIILLVLLLAGGILFIVLNPKDSPKPNNNKPISNKDKKVEGIDVVDVNSKKRPLAISINNTPVAIKVQQGLNKAYIVYEIPTEGYTSRLLAIYKGDEDVKFGTIRSARHNMIDFSYDNDAIFVAYGWSHYAQDQLTSGAINYVNGIAGEGGMYRENPLDLDSEHTVNMNTSTVYDYAANTKGYSLESDNTILLKYNKEDVDLSSREGAMTANRVYIDYGSVENNFYYDSETKMYKRNVNDVDTKDFGTGELFTTKNIIIEKISYYPTDDNHYWNLNCVGDGDGYYVTNGQAVPIKWSKADRTSKTKYTYLDGSEIEVSDGRTYIEVMIHDRPLTIE
jgi:hypothetical protein